VITINEILNGLDDQSPLKKKVSSFLKKTFHPNPSLLRTQSDAGSGAGTKQLTREDATSLIELFNTLRLNIGIDLLPDRVGTYLVIANQSGLEIVYLDDIIPVQGQDMTGVESPTLHLARLMTVYKNTQDAKAKVMRLDDASIWKEIFYAGVVNVNESVQHVTDKTPHTQRLLLKFLYLCMVYYHPDAAIKGLAYQACETNVEILYTKINDIIEQFPMNNLLELITTVIRELKNNIVSKDYLEVIETISRKSDERFSNFFIEFKNIIKDYYPKGGAPKRTKKHTKKGKSKMLKGKSKKHLKKLKKSKKGKKTGKNVHFHSASKTSKKNTRKRR
jgi:hypothetical protein